MKISAKLLLITFLIVVVVSAASTIIYHSVANKLLQSQQFNSLLYSKNDFINRFENEIVSMKNEFDKISSRNGTFTKKDYGCKNIDFLFAVNSNSAVEFIYYKNKQIVAEDRNVRTISDFVAKHPYIVFDYQINDNGQTVYFGKIINENFLDSISEKINVDIALIINNKLIAVSNKYSNTIIENEIDESIQKLKSENSKFVFRKDLETTDYFASIYNPQNVLSPAESLSFLVFNRSSEAQKFRSTMNLIMLVLITSGILLSLIFILLSTTRLRKQIGLISESVEISGSGDLNHRVKIITNDEIGRLGTAFNQMMDELKNKDRDQKDYSEFLTLINENPSLAEVSEAALTKIISSTSLSFGVLYLVDEKKELRLLASNGVDENYLNSPKEIDLYKNVIKHKQSYEYKFTENHPTIKTSAAKIKICYLVTYPIIYNKSVIGILELGSHSQPVVDVQFYLKNIHEQLAVGLTNSAAFEHAEQLVKDLSELNKDYQNQNEHITEQNKKLVALHKELSANAEELESERQKALESARVKSQFLATMSHELKTPLNSILGLSELVLNEKGILDKTKDRNGIILRNGRRLLSIINNILEFSKLDFGKIELEKESFSLNKFLKQISSSVEPLISEKNFKFSIEYPTNVDFSVNSDKSKIEHVLLNLITNAIKFTDEGFVKLKVLVHENHTAEFKVIDSGIGIDKENIDMIFEEFRQIDTGTSRKYGGAGLGLAICKRYSELLGGQLTVQSELNKGSEFTFILPNSVSVDEESKQELESDLIYNNESFNGKKKILVICRDINTNRTLQKYLDSDEYETIIYNTGKEGIEAAKNNIPDLISLDLDVEDMSGWDILMQLKNNESTMNIPVVAASIFEEEDLCYEFDVFDFLFKNSSQERIKSIIKNIESFEQSKIKSILTIDYGDGAIEALKKDIGEEYTINNIFVEDDAFKVIADSKPDLLLVNLIAPSFDELNFINTIKQNSGTRLIPVVLSISQNLSESEISRINSAIKNLTRKAQHHPLDILKLIRKRLNMDQGWTYSNSSLNFRLKAVPSDEKTPSKGTILIVDDDEDTLFTVSEIVCNLGYKTLTAKNGIECLLAIDKLKPDLVLLDIMMPKMDGFETIKRIRNDKSISDLPVLAMTAHAMLDDIDIIERNGFDDILTKPVDTSAIALKVENGLKKTQQIKS
jgi:signal transduction histidine kinase/DNA-binding response OmpR family regulator/HAMP domain-containing protein